MCVCVDFRDLELSKQHTSQSSTTVFSIVNEGRLLREWAKKCVQQIYLHLLLSSFQYISMCGSRCRSITHECDCTRKPDVECKTSLYEMTWNQVLCLFCCWILRCRVCVPVCVYLCFMCIAQIYYVFTKNCLPLRNHRNSQHEPIYMYFCLILIPIQIAWIKWQQ